jgi:hypothetical protein
MALSLLINGKPVTEPIEWRDIQIKSAFGTNSNQPSIESDRFTLVRNASSEVFNHIQQGKIFEELTAQMIFDNETIFDGFVDTSDELEEIDVAFGQGNEQPNQVSVKFKKNEAIQYFTEKINGVSFFSLYEDGFITDNDFVTVRTIIRKKANFLEIAIMLVSIYLIQKQIQDTIKEINKTIQEIIAIVTGSAIGGFAGAVYTIAIAIIQIAYSIALFALLTKLVLSLIQIIVPPKVNNKGINFRKLLEKACDYFGYTFESNIPDLLVYNYLPSKPFSNSEKLFEKILDTFIPRNPPNKNGLPSTSDYGYLINEFFDLCTSMFNARVDVIDNRVLMYNADDEFWFNQSNYQCPINLQLKNKRYNTGDLPQTRMLSFVTDVNDDWTIENFTGTAYEIKTETETGNLGTIKGIDRIDFPICLPNSKSKRSPLEEIVYQMAKWCDELTKLIGKKSNFASTFDQAVNNILMVSDNNWTIPKVVPLIGSNIPSNHREICSAKYLYENYHFGKSFVTNGALGQKLIYNDIDIPFTIKDLEKTLNTGAFILPDGRKARFKEITYLLGRDTANIDIEVQEIYTTRLKEKYYEP